MTKPALALAEHALRRNLDLVALQPRNLPLPLRLVLPPCPRRDRRALHLLVQLGDVLRSARALGLARLGAVADDALHARAPGAHADRLLRRAAEDLLDLLATLRRRVVAIFRFIALLGRPVGCGRRRARADGR
jgi:hypothetical protein